MPVIVPDTALSIEPPAPAPPVPPVVDPVPFGTTPPAVPASPRAFITQPQRIRFPEISKIIHPPPRPPIPPLTEKIVEPAPPPPPAPQSIEYCFMSRKTVALKLLLRVPPVPPTQFGEEPVPLAPFEPLLMVEAQPPP